MESNSNTFVRVKILISFFTGVKCKQMTLTHFRNTSEIYELHSKMYVLNIWKHVHSDIVICNSMSLDLKQCQLNSLNTAASLMQYSHAKEFGKCSCSLTQSWIQSEAGTLCPSEWQMELPPHTDRITDEYSNVICQWHN